MKNMGFKPKKMFYSTYNGGTAVREEPSIIWNVILQIGDVREYSNYIYSIRQARIKAI